MQKRRKSYPRSVNFKAKFDMKDNSILKIKWISPNDKKENTINFYIDFKDDNFLTIKDNH